MNSLELFFWVVDFWLRLKFMEWTAQLNENYRQLNNEIVVLMSLKDWSLFFLLGFLLLLKSNLIIFVLENCRSKWPLNNKTKLNIIFITYEQQKSNHAPQTTCHFNTCKSTEKHPTDHQVLASGMVKKEKLESQKRLELLTKWGSQMDQKGYRFT